MSARESADQRRIPLLFVDLLLVSHRVALGMRLVVGLGALRCHAPRTFKEIQAIASCPRIRRSGGLGCRRQRGRNGLRDRRQWRCNAGRCSLAHLGWCDGRRRGRGLRRHDLRPWLRRRREFYRRRLWGGNDGCRRRLNHRRWTRDVRRTVCDSRAEGVPAAANDQDCRQRAPCADPVRSGLALCGPDRRGAFRIQPSIT